MIYPIRRRTACTRQREACGRAEAAQEQRLYALGDHRHCGVRSIVLRRHNIGEQRLYAGEIGQYLGQGATPVQLQQLKEQGYEPSEIVAIVSKVKASASKQQGGAGEIRNSLGSRTA